jgi:putative transposase
VLDLLREPRFVDLAPAEIYACLLDEGVYLCSIRIPPGTAAFR